MQQERLGTVQFILTGNSLDDLALRGPFRDEEDANAYARDNLADVNWSLIEPSASTLPVDVALTTVWDDAVEETFRTEENDLHDDLEDEDEAGRTTWYHNDILTRFTRTFMSRGLEL